MKQVFTWTLLISGLFVVVCSLAAPTMEIVRGGELGGGAILGFAVLHLYGLVVMSAAVEAHRSGGGK